MVLSDTLLTVLVLLALALGAVSVLLLAPRALRERARSRSTAPADKALEAQVGANTQAINRLEGAMRRLAVGERKLGEMMEVAVRHVGVVRFDAFEDMGGRLSFSAAFLDGHGNGVVITSINGRQDTRCYAKQVQGGRSVHHLSDEERQAIREALQGPRRVVEAS